MAINRRNDVTEGLSGKFGRQICFRQVGDTTEVYRRPGKRTTPSTPAQQAIHNQFLNALYYARTVIADPVKKAIYRDKVKGRRSAFSLAVADYFKAPEVKFINASHYNGLLGDVIKIQAVDNFKVVSVKVEITDGSGAVLEQGEATPLPGNIEWEYKATVPNRFIQRSQIKATATDVPGNTGALFITL
jgi:hypothetical protein